VAHFEVITTPDGIPYLVEVGGRAGGGHTLHPIVSHVSGINYPELIACLYLRRVDDVRKMLSQGIDTKGAVYSFPVTNLSGTIKSIGILETGVGTRVELWKKPGDTGSGMNSSMDRLGCVVSLAETREAAILESRRTMASFFVQVV
jgi:biotin carboxylase